MVVATAVLSTDRIQTVVFPVTGITVTGITVTDPINNPRASAVFTRNRSRSIRKITEKRVAHRMGVVPVANTFRRIRSRERGFIGVTR